MPIFMEEKKKDNLNIDVKIVAIIGLVQMLWGFFLSTKLYRTHLIAI
ncbi:MAG: hypothetical protein F6K17_23130 [Okeania sp. SIO3C4]|nr:hypothetical protein [Okeania sp. SIO3B3]NER05278.1 hypothetical protein [Okeania sp. SIO3C4]